jgi:hypothetical protein
VRGEVVLFAQQHGEPAAGRVAGDARAVDAAAYDEQVERGVLRHECALMSDVTVGFAGLSLTGSRETVQAGAAWLEAPQIAESRPKSVFSFSNSNEHIRKSKVHLASHLPGWWRAAPRRTILLAPAISR